jgi:hypothetical protein
MTRPFKIADCVPHRVAALAASAACFFALPASASVVASLHEGTSCTGANTVQYAAGGPAKKVAVCVSTTSEKLCGVSYRLKVSSATFNNQFQITARQAGASYNDLTPASLPQGIVNAPTGDIGAAPSPQTPVPAGANQLIAVLDILPTASATSTPYTLSLDTPFSIALVDQDNACGATTVEPTEETLSASIVFTQGTPPQITNANATTFTVGFNGSFQVVADGTPAPTLSIGGAMLPVNITFTPATGLLSGIPQLGTVGSYNLTFTATNGNAPDTTQNFTLTVQKANQAISFAPLANKIFGASPFAVSATTTAAGLTVAFASATPSTCSVAGSTVTLVAAGTCTVNATQAGNANFNPASNVAQSFTISASTPNPPTIGTATPGNASVTVSFTAPVVSGGAPIQSYTATCGGGAASATGTMSPITVTGLTNGTPVNCFVTAFNGSFNSTASMNSNTVTPLGLFTVTPSAGANGSIAPAMPVVVTQGTTTMFTVTPDAGYAASVGGTCGGFLSGTTYTTSAVTTNCTVEATFVALITFNVVLEGAQEIPALPVTGSGSGTAIINTAANTITLNLTFAGLTGAATAAHLHGPAVRGMSAAPIANIGLVSPITNTVSFSEGQQADILAGRWYVNIHTTANSGGELRGQLDNLGAATKTLSVNVVGNGTVTGIGVNCPGDCSESYAHNTVVALTTTPGMGQSFTGWSGACSGTGACNVTMNLLKSVTATFAISSYTVTPSAGLNGTISPSMPVATNHGTTLNFTVTPEMGFTAVVTGTCGGSLTGNTFTTNTITADCTVIASFNPNIALVRVESRKLHNTFECNVPVLTGIAIGGNVSVEPRNAGAGHQIVFVFNTAVSSLGGVTVTPTGIASASFSGQEVRVNLNGLTDATRVTVSISGVNGAANEIVSLGFLRGDVSGSRATSASDISAVKSRIDAMLTSANCAADINVDGQIKSTDVSTVKSRSGSTLP